MCFFNFDFFNFFLDFSILGRFGEAPGLPKIEQNPKKIIVFSRSVLKGGSGRVLGGFRECFGRILGTFWEGFGWILGRFCS